MPSLTSSSVEGGETQIRKDYGIFGNLVGMRGKEAETEGSRDGRKRRQIKAETKGARDDNAA